MKSERTVTQYIHTPTNGEHSLGCVNVSSGCTTPTGGCK